MYSGNTLKYQNLTVVNGKDKKLQQKPKEKHAV